VDAPGTHPIWLAGMRFPLDLLWIDGDGRVLSVLPNVPPCRAEPCTIYEPRGTDRSVAVLELPAVGAARDGLTAGTTVSRFTIFPVASEHPPRRHDKRRHQRAR
jgi:hypothetical protein